MTKQDLTRCVARGGGWFIDFLKDFGHSTQKVIDSGVSLQRLLPFLSTQS